MITVGFHADGFPSQMKLTWCLDDEQSLYDSLTPPLNSIYLVTATGDELVEINKRFTGIPKANTESVTWTGDIARFIVLNM